MKRLFWAACVAYMAVGGVLHGSGFAMHPTVTAAKSSTDGSPRWRIAFAAREPVDATVAIVAADGRIVRHLASGALGSKAPPPLQPGALEQVLFWDGRDDAGRIVPAAAGGAAGYRVEVGLGLRASFSRILYAMEPGIESRGPVSLTCDPQGNLYIMWGHLFTGRFTQLGFITAFDRDGNYLRTVKPFRADWPDERVSAVDWLNTADGRRVPLSGPNNHTPFSGYLRGISHMQRHTACIARDGRYIFVSGRPVADDAGVSSRRLLAIRADGSCPRDEFIGPPLPENAWMGDLFLCLSPDNRHYYFSGTYHARKKSLHHAVYRVEWNERATPKPFLGIECEAGNNDAHFNTPRGLATDSAGRLYVCDYMNDRIQVFSSEGALLRSLPVRGPEQVAVHPRTGALYVLSIGDRGATKRYAEVRWEVYGQKSLVKFASLDDFTELARCDFPRKERYFHDSGPSLVLDASGEQPLIWVSTVVQGAPTDFLWRIVDQDGQLLRSAHQVVTQPRGSSVSSPMVAAARDGNEFYLVGGGLGGAFRGVAGTGRLEKVPLPEGALKWLGDAVAAADGTLYLSCGKVIDPPRDMRWIIRRYGRDGQPVAFKATEGIATIGYHGGTYAGEKCGPFAVAPDGKIYVSEGSRPGGTARARVNVYDADGELLKAGLITDMTRTAGPLAVDGQGRLYVGDAVKPAGQGAGSEYPAFLGTDPRKHFRMWYGTVCRFGPEGGAFRHVADGQPFTHVGGYPGGRGKVVIEGALWQYYGMSPMPQSSNCECPAARLAADGFGRLFVPDVCTHAVQILDSEGNLMTRFGQYGNMDARGPGSEVTLPEIPLRYPFDVAVLDRHVAVADTYNRRVVELSLSYAVSEVAALP